MMQQQRKRQPTVLERFLFGPRVNDGLQAKGLFQVEPYQNLVMSQWAGPNVPMYPAGTYGGRINYTVEAGDLIDNSAVMACINWLMRTFPQSKPRVVLENDSGLDPVPVPNHPLTALLKRPNPFYSGTQLWRATVTSYYWDGNAYWRKVRNAVGQVIQLWYEPHWTIRPVRRSSDDFITTYQLWRNREWVDVPVEDIVHFRWSFSAYNQMLGMAPLASALRDVFTDNEAARYTAVMFRNLGVVGGIVSSGSEDLPINNVDQLKAELQALTTGDERGKWLVQDVPLDFKQMDTDPTKMDTRANRKIGEERISALLGVPASVAGLGAGLDRNTFTNSEEAIKWAYNNNIIPTQDSMAEELDIQLVPDFTNVEAQTIEFNQAKITVLQGDQAQKDQSTALLYNAGVIKRSEARKRAGQVPAEDGSDDIFKPAPIPAFPPASALSAPPQGGGGQEGAAAEQPIKSNGHLALGLDLEVKAQEKRPTRRTIEEAIAAEVKDEIERVYDEAAGKL